MIIYFVLQVVAAVSYVAGFFFYVESDNYDHKYYKTISSVWLGVCSLALITMFIIAGVCVNENE